jgi:hypothetical protein
MRSDILTARFPVMASESSSVRITNCSISSHGLRTLDCDTTFKPVVGDMHIFEINGWLVGINECTQILPRIIAC